MYDQDRVGWEMKINLRMVLLWFGVIENLRLCSDLSLGHITLYDKVCENPELPCPGPCSILFSLIIKKFQISNPKTYRAE